MKKCFTVLLPILLTVTTSCSGIRNVIRSIPTQSPSPVPTDTGKDDKGCEVPASLRQANTVGEGYTYIILEDGKAWCKYKNGVLRG